MRAGDWIKMRNNLWDDPRISQICDLTDALEATVIGGLYWLWSAADEHTEDGFMPGLSTSGIDRKTGVKGLGKALVSIGWIEDGEGGITILRFDEHNGSSAKRRSADAQRKANSRNLSAQDADTSRTEEGQDRTSCGAREEKNREEKKEEQKTTTSAKAPKFDFGAKLFELGADEKSIRDWMAVRKVKRAANTETVIENLIRESAKAGISVADAVLLCATKSWQGFEADWLKPKQQGPTQIPTGDNRLGHLGKHGQATASAAQEWLEETNAG